jgi:predicted AAA+ superfamily ATPase
MSDLDRLAARLNALLDRLEPLLPAEMPETDWSAPAYRWRRIGAGGFLQSILEPHAVRLSDLLGIDTQKSLLERNTRQFLIGLPANNALLWGSRGTGKSSLIKALLAEYADQGLRLVEVDKAHLMDLPDIVERLAGRNEHYIVFTDDLSFEAGDPSYKPLKALLDGSVAAPPENLLIYATSNRRHLLPEYMKENLEASYREGEVHHGEGVEEKISLSERFGLWLSFYPFSQDQYLEIAAHWLGSLSLSLDEPARAEALRFALARGSRSGRVAHQFARDWAGQQGLSDNP